ncbi:hypothetical protein PE067_09215 [Paracoccus sp. DMF-8]|nr:hypothetical protein [Paracoccus sp. DMF-8]MDF3606297.1 hypothetical protein [Paracoccus sp. DMF-8]
MPDRSSTAPTEKSMRHRSTAALMADLITILAGLIVIAEKLF